MPSFFNGVFGHKATGGIVPILAAGLPLGVQVVAPRRHDHLSIAVAMVLETTMSGWQTPQFVPTRTWGLLRFRT